MLVQDLMCIGIFLSNAMTLVEMLIKTDTLSDSFYLEALNPTVPIHLPYLLYRVGHKTPIKIDNCRFFNTGE